MQVRPAERSERSASKMSPAEAMKSTSTAISRRVLPELKPTESEKTEVSHNNKKRGVSVESKILEKEPASSKLIKKPQGCETTLNTSKKKIPSVSKDPIRQLKNKKKTLILQRS